MTEEIISGKRRAQRISEKLRADGPELEIPQHSDEFISGKSAIDMMQAFEMLGRLPENFMVKRSDKPPQTRESLEHIVL
jgi:hypothetical protein